MAIVEIIPGALDLLVRRMTWEADDVLSVVLSRDGGGELPEWQFGAHIDLILRRDLIRQYSLCGRPENRSEWKIAILLEPVGTGGSKYVHEELRPGMRVGAAGPRNNFPLVESPHYLFIAGGIGVTPLVPMVFGVAKSHSDWKLLYGGRRRASMAFVDELRKLGPCVTIAPEDEVGLLDLRGAIEAAPSEAAIYCCGPEALISAVENECSLVGRTEPHVERFKARPGFASEVDTSGDIPFELVLANSGVRLEVPTGKTILDALNEANIFAPTSCSEGYCGVCETEVISGIPDHRDDYLSPEDRATNKTMMICVGRSKTPELVIKL